MAAVSNYQTLVDYTRAAAALAADASAFSATQRFGSRECFMIDSIECAPPVTGAGVFENLRLQLWIDGVLFPDMNIDSRILGPYNAFTNTLGLKLGVARSVDPLQNTCPKGNDSIRVEATAMVGGVTQALRVRVKGWKFIGDEALRNFFSPYTLPGHDNIFNPENITVRDPVRGKSVDVYNPLEITVRNFSRLSGGAAMADNPKILPFYRTGNNLNATAGNGAEYELNQQLNGNVPTYGDMFFDLDDSKAILLQRFGVLPHANSRYAYVKINGSDFFPESPNFWDVTEELNELPFGVSTQDQQARAYEQPLLITNELAVACIRDNGTAIPANGLFYQAIGKQILLD